MPHPAGFREVERIKGFRVNTQGLTGHAYVDLADAVGAVAGIGKRAGYRGEGRVQVDAVGADVVSARSQAREQRGARGHAERIVDISTSQQRAAGRQLIEVGRLQRRIVSPVTPCARHAVAAHLVGKDDEEIRSLVHVVLLMPISNALRFLLGSREGFP